MAAGRPPPISSCARRRTAGATPAHFGAALLVKAERLTHPDAAARAPLVHTNSDALAYVGYRIKAPPARAQLIPPRR